MGSEEVERPRGKGGVWWVLRTQGASVAETISSRRLVENEFRERAEMPIRKTFTGQYIDLAFILKALGRGVTRSDIF